MHIALWIIQALLSVVFIMAGGSKLAMSPDEMLANGMTFVNYIPEPLILFIGLAELAGGIGLILPCALKIYPKLTPIAAGLLALVMTLAVGAHLTHDEAAVIGAPLFLGVLCSFVAWGRAVKVPMESRS